MFEGRTLLIATKHQKERVIAPILEKELGVKCVVANDFDTDKLGTFTGEVDRIDDPITTARKKCLLALEVGSYDLCVASEGSFGPHPTFYFMSADEEWLFFIDKKNGWEIFVREISTNTNFDGAVVKSEEELMDFARHAKFPEHGLILRKSKDDTSLIEKGILDTAFLKQKFQYLMHTYQSVYVETDMRAMYNPTRMQVIETATLKLAKKIKTICPSCSTPGFGITDRKEGLPCGLCGRPTHSTLSFIHACNKCSFEVEEKFPNGKQTEEPRYCDYCNP